MGKLKIWADENSPYIMLADGESIIGQYVGYKMIPSHFDPEKEVVQYTLLIDGKEKFFKSGSNSVALQFDKMEDNAMVQITRQGEDRNTKYIITEVTGDEAEIKD